MFVEYEKKGANKVITVTLFTSAVLFGIGWLLPWHVGMFGLSGRVHGTAYQFFFAISLYVMILSYFLSAKMTESYYRIALKGIFYGYIASVISYLYAYGIFYFDYGFSNIGRVFLTDFTKFAFSYLIYPVFLGGWAYGFILILVNRKIFGYIVNTHDCR